MKSWKLASMILSVILFAFVLFLYHSIGNTLYDNVEVDTDTKVIIPIILVVSTLSIVIKKTDKVRENILLFGFFELMFLPLLLMGDKFENFKPFEGGCLINSVLAVANSFKVNLKKEKQDEELKVLGNNLYLINQVNQEKTTNKKQIIYFTVLCFSCLVGCSSPTKSVVTVDPKDIGTELQSQMRLLFDVTNRNYDSAMDVYSFANEDEAWEYRVTKDNTYVRLYDEYYSYQFEEMLYELDSYVSYRFSDDTFLLYLNEDKADGVSILKYSCLDDEFTMLKGNDWYYPSEQTLQLFEDIHLTEIMKMDLDNFKNELISNGISYDVLSSVDYDDVVNTVFNN